jgi:multiple sugar transport system substrate-binding protein
LTAGAAVVLGALWLAGCSYEQSDHRTELVLYDFAYVNWTAMNRQRLRRFEAQNPDLKVRLVTGDYSKLLTMVAGGVAPDVAYIDYVYVPYFAKRGAVVCLDEWVAREGGPQFLDRFFASTLAGVRYRGRLYALPDAWSPVLLYYNKSLFDRHNREQPDQPLTYPNADWTWDDFRRAAKLLTADLDGDGRTDRFGALVPASHHRWPIFVWQNGGEVTSADHRRCLMDTPEAMGGIQFLYDLMFVDKSMPGAHTQIEGVAEQDMNRWFAEQHLAMIYTTRYYQKDLAEVGGFEWDVAPLPRGKNRSTIYIGGTWLLFSQSLHQPAAWRLMKFLSDDASSELSMQCGRALAANRATAARLTRHPGTPPEHDPAFVEYGDLARPKQFEYLDISKACHDAFLEIEMVRQGLRTPETACRNYTRIMNGALDTLWREKGGP